MWGGRGGHGPFTKCEEKTSVLVEDGISNQAHISHQLKEFVISIDNEIYTKYFPVAKDILSTYISTIITHTPIWINCII